MARISFPLVRPSSLVGLARVPQSGAAGAILQAIWFDQPSVPGSESYRGDRARSEAYRGTRTDAQLYRGAGVLFP